MKTLLNIIWHIPFLGFLWALVDAIIGCIWCITIVGLPIGLGLLQFSKFLLSPFSRAMVNQSDVHTMKQTEQNQLWKGFSLIVRILYFPIGLLGALSALGTIVVEFISILGIPCGIVWAKSLSTIFNPVNKVCVSRNVYEEIEKVKKEKEIAQFKK